MEGGEVTEVSQPFDGSQGWYLCKLETANSHSLLPPFPLPGQACSASSFLAGNFSPPTWGPSLWSSSTKDIITRDVHWKYFDVVPRARTPIAKSTRPLCLVMKLVQKIRRMEGEMAEK